MEKNKHVNIFVCMDFTFLPGVLHISLKGASHFSPGASHFSPRGLHMFPLGRNLKFPPKQKCEAHLCKKYLHFYFSPLYVVAHLYCYQLSQLSGCTDIHTKGHRPRLLSCWYLISELPVPAWKLLLPGKNFIYLYVLQFP